MSSDQYSEKPLPPQKKECPRCGELMPVSAKRCWLCLERFPAQSVIAQPEAPVPAKPSEAIAAGSPPVARKAPPIRFEKISGATIGWLIGGALLLVLVGVVAYEAPGLLFCLLAFGPGLIFFVATARHQDVSESPLQGCLLVFATIGVIAITSIFSLILAIAYACSPHPAPEPKKGKGGGIRWG
jgi:hypothetical protein